MKQERKLVGIVSPPYAHESTPMKTTEWQKEKGWKAGHQTEVKYTEDDYRFKKSKSKGNIGKTKLYKRIPCSPDDPEAKQDKRPERKGTEWEWTKEVEITVNDISPKLVGITSPPFEDMLVGKANVERKKELLERAGYNPKDYIGGKARNLQIDNRYGSSIGQIGLPKSDEKDRKRLVGITSPPYDDIYGSARHGHKIRTGQSKLHQEKRLGKSYTSELGKQNIGNLRPGNIENEELDLSMFHKCDDSLVWHGCYESDARFRHFLTSESFAHPAKMSMLLADRIFKHLKALGLLNKGDVICDFMSGTGRTGIMASLHGHDSVHVELEPHFIKMINENKKLCEKKFQRQLNWKVIQGDARKLSELLTEKGLVGVISPPFAEAQSGGGIVNNGYMNTGDDVASRCGYKDEKFSDQNISNLPDKNLVGITSPPFMESLTFIKKPSKACLDKKVGHLNVIKYANIPNKSIGGSRTPEAIAERASKRNIGQINVFGNKGTYIPQSYLSAMLQVYVEAFRSGISPLVTVTKNPTRQGKLRRLDIDTARLLIMAGYKIVDYHRALLFEEQKQATLTGNIKKQVKGRLSFFKQLSYKKGNVVAQHEDVIIAVIPNVSGLVGVTSPPYSEMMQTEKHGNDEQFNQSYDRKYSKNPKNIGNLKDR